MQQAHRLVPSDELVFDVEQALRKVRRVLPRKVEPGSFDPFRPAARAIVEHLELCGIRCWRKPPLAPHGTGLGPPDAGSKESQAGDREPPPRRNKSRRAGSSCAPT